MRRIILSLTLALVGLLAFGSLTPLPSAHAQTATPSLTATPNPVQAGSTATITGQNFTPNNSAYVYLQRPDGTIGTLYTATSSTGTISFNLGFLASHGTGNEYIYAYDFGTARWSSILTVVVQASVPVPVRQLSVSSTTATPGTTITVSGKGFTPNNWAYVYFQRPDATAGAFWTYTGGSGGFSNLLGFSATHGCGTETIWAYDWATGQWSAPVTVTVTGCSTLAAPSNLQIVSYSVGSTSDRPTTVNLQWRDNSSSETGFRIRTTLNRLYGGSDTQTQTVGANTTTAQVTFTAGGINPVKTACFTVTAFNGATESAPSNGVCLQLIP
jgi:hypothetical protein